MLLASKAPITAGVLIEGNAILFFFHPSFPFFSQFLLNHKNHFSQQKPPGDRSFSYKLPSTFLVQPFITSLVVVSNNGGTIPPNNVPKKEITEALTTVTQIYKSELSLRKVASDKDLESCFKRFTISKTKTFTAACMVQCVSASCYAPLVVIQRYMVRN